MIEPVAPPPAETLTRLRAAFADVPPGSGPASADAEQIWAAVHGPGEGESETNREALIDRLHDDPQLALEWRLAAALGPLEADDVHVGAPTVAAQPAPVSRPRWASVSAVVGITIAAAAALVLWMAAPTPPAPPSSDPTLRAPQEQPLLSTEIEAGIAVPRTDFRLHWQSDVEGASSFTVRVTTQDLQPIYEANDLSTTAVQVPQTALESVAAGTVLLWRVEAVEPGGRRHASEIWELTVE